MTDAAHSYSLAALTAHGVASGVAEGDVDGSGKSPLPELAAHAP